MRPPALLCRSLSGLACLLLLAGCGGQDPSADPGSGKGRRLPPVLRKAREEKAKAGLAQLRTALMMISAQQRTFPATIEELGAASEIPRLDLLLEAHAPSREVVAYDEMKVKDTGRWAYVGNKDSGSWGALYIDCTHTDSRGVAWNDY